PAGGDKPYCHGPYCHGSYRRGSYCHGLVNGTGDPPVSVPAHRPQDTYRSQDIVDDLFDRRNSTKAKTVG
ncbi:hypothetical protein, partial [Protofrankia coriariae]|uniref:hypothetical protein n=1 Tax=Protofrankia coriariae TaxID=1562887 RepID=UPI001F215D61